MYKLFKLNENNEIIFSALNHDHENFLNRQQIISNKFKFKAINLIKSYIKFYIESYI